MYHTSGNLPKHQYVWVDLSFVSKGKGVLPAVWFGVCSIPGRMWGCHLLLENGAVYRSVPPHAISFTEELVPYTAKQSQLWDCYSSTFSIVEYNYLYGLRCKTLPSKESGRYLFTAIPYGEGFSEYPEQAKEFFFIQLDSGRLCILPTNKIVFEDASFTRNMDLSLEVSQTIHRCE